MINSSKLHDKRCWVKWEDSGAIGWVKPPPCDNEIFSHGSSIALLDAKSGPAERWVRTIARRADARIDWHYSGGVAHVLHLGDAESRERVISTMRLLERRLKGTLMRIYDVIEPGLYRAGVTIAPDGAIGSYMGDNGSAVYMVA